MEHFIRCWSSFANLILKLNKYYFGNYLGKENNLISTEFCFLFCFCDLLGKSSVLTTLKIFLY